MDYKHYGSGLGYHDEPVTKSAAIALIIGVIIIGTILINMCPDKQAETSSLIDRDWVKTATLNQLYSAQIAINSEIKGRLQQP